MITAEQIMRIINVSILEWHRRSILRPLDYIIVTEDMKTIRPLNQHRNNLKEVIEDLVMTNTEMWHEQDKVRSDKDDVVLKAIRNISPLNQRRNDLIEEIDEIVEEQVGRGRER